MQIHNNIYNITPDKEIYKEYIDITIKKIQGLSFLELRDYFENMIIFTPTSQDKARLKSEMAFEISKNFNNFTLPFIYSFSDFKSKSDEIFIRAGIYSMLNSHDNIIDEKSKQNILYKYYSKIEPDYSYMEITSKIKFYNYIYNLYWEDLNLDLSLLDLKNRSIDVIERNSNFKRLYDLWISHLIDTKKSDAEINYINNIRNFAKNIKSSNCNFIILGSNLNHNSIRLFADNIIKYNKGQVILSYSDLTTDTKSSLYPYNSIDNFINNIQNFKLDKSLIKHQSIFLRFYKCFFSNEPMAHLMQEKKNFEHIKTINTTNIDEAFFIAKLVTDILQERETNITIFCDDIAQQKNISNYIHKNGYVTNIHNNNENIKKEIIYFSSIIINFIFNPCDILNINSILKADFCGLNEKSKLLDIIEKLPFYNDELDYIKYNFNPHELNLYDFISSFNIFQREKKYSLFTVFAQFKKAVTFFANDEFKLITEKIEQNITDIQIKGSDLNEVIKEIIDIIIVEDKKTSLINLTSTQYTRYPKEGVIIFASLCHENYLLQAIPKDITNIKFLEKIGFYRFKSQFFADILRMLHYENIFFFNLRVNDDKQTEPIYFLEILLSYLAKHHEVNFDITEEISKIKKYHIAKFDTEFQKDLTSSKFPLPNRITSSQITDLINCPLIYFFKNILLLRENNHPTRTIPKLLEGNIAHDILCKYFKNIYDNASHSYEIFENIFDSVIANYPTKYKALHCDAFKLNMWQLISVLEENNIFLAREVACEKQININVDINDISYNFLSFIDRLDHFQDYSQIIDYKSKINAKKRPLFEYQLFFSMLILEKLGTKEKITKLFIQTIRENNRKPDKSFRIENEKLETAYNNFCDDIIKLISYYQIADNYYKYINFVENEYGNLTHLSRIEETKLLEQDND